MTSATATGKRASVSVASRQAAAVMSAKDLAASTSSATVAAPALAARATAYWTMDVSLPGVLDQSGHGNHLTRYMQPAVSDLPFILGANQFSGQNLTGRLAKWGGWRRLLTSAEKAALRAGEGWPFATTASLRDAAVFYLLNESSNAATYRDATGRGNTLTRTGGAITQVAGPLGTDKGARFGSAGISFLSLYPATPDVAYGNSVHTISGWVNLDALGTSQQIFWGQLVPTTPTKVGNCLYYFSATDRLQSDFANNVDLYRNAVVVSLTSPPPGTGTWRHMLFDYDPAANVEGLEIDGVRDELAEVVRPAPRTSPSRLHFAVPPQFNSLQSGWDNIGVQCFASHASNADLAIGPSTKTVWGWVRFDNAQSLQTVMGFLRDGVNYTDWVVQQSGGQLYFVLGDGAGGLDFCSVALSDTNWHCFVAWYDRTGDGKLHLNLDNGARVASASVTHTPAASSLQFLMGACTSPAAATGYNQQLLGDLGVCGISTGAPSSAEIANLYAFGSGRYY